MLKIKRVLVIITGSVASYKALSLIRLFTKSKIEVNCVMTKSAKNFITPLSVSSLSGKKVYENFQNCPKSVAKNVSRRFWGCLVFG